MKKYSEIRENLESFEPGNTQGITNRYTPINNIIVNVRNYFGATYGITVVESANNAIKLRCSRWINTDEAYKDICNINVGQKTISSYICSQGLNEMKLIKEGDRIAAIFYASDIKNDTTKFLNKIPDATVYTDAHANEDCEILTWYKIKDGKLFEGKEDDSELEDETPKEIRELINAENKVKSVDKFAEIISQQVDLPAEYYWKAVKDKDGNESIALRHKREKRRPFGKKAEVVDSIINIYGEGDEAIWVDGYDDIENMPEDMKNLIENILQLLGAEKTGDVCVYALKELGASKDDEGEGNTEDNDDNDDDNDNSAEDKDNAEKNEIK